MTSAYLRATSEPPEFLLNLMNTCPLDQDSMVWMCDRTFSHKRMDLFALVYQHPLYHHVLHKRVPSMLLNNVRQDHLPTLEALLGVHKPSPVDLKTTIITTDDLWNVCQNYRPSVDKVIEVLV